MGEEQDFSKLRVLVIDDEPFMLDVIARALRGLHVKEVLKAVDCLEARDIILRNRLVVHCVIADFNMKPINGLQFLQRIRAGEEAGIPTNQPFIMLTGNARSEVVTAAVALDVNAYLVKPIAAAKLGSALERAMVPKENLKSPKYYQAVNIQVADVFNDAPEKAKRESFRIPKDAIIRPAETTTFLDKKSSATSGSVPVDTGRDVSKPSEVATLRMCSLAKLKENMILGEDIEDEDGAVLIRSGTALTKKMVDRLHEVTGNRKFILVAKSR